MQITKRHWAALIIGFVIAVVAAGWYYKAEAPTVGSESPTATTTEEAVTATTTPATELAPFTLNSADRLTAWSFTGTYSSSDALIAQANADIARLTGLVGKGEYDDYDLYLGIGNDKGLLGDGRAAYDNYMKAVAIHPKKGLAFVNIGNLMKQLRAYATAADAYQRATTVEPGVLEYHVERVTYLTQQFPKDTARITAALADVTKVFGDTAQILALEAQWLAGQGRYADAIKAWETVKMLSPGKDTTPIDTEIARLQAKLK